LKNLLRGAEQKHHAGGFLYVQERVLRRKNTAVGRKSGKKKISDAFASEIFGECE
jgi:hypothetical protein